MAEAVLTSGRPGSKHSVVSMETRGAGLRTESGLGWRGGQCLAWRGGDERFLPPGGPTTEGSQGEEGVLRALWLLPAGGVGGWARGLPWG